MLVCELIAHPWANMGISDDGPYILMARTTAATGHILYNGQTTPFLGWQLYLAAAFIHLFGFSFTIVRSSTLLISVLMAFLLQRTLVRSGISETNATLATLALVLSPLYLMLSVTFMTDISGLFAILLCLYACLRSLQASSSSSTLAWLCFAVLSNALCGSSRQIAWLGILVLVPSTLWILHSQHHLRRRFLLAGIAANLAGVLCILACMLWFLHQPYNVHEPLLPHAFPLVHTSSQLIHSALDLPFLLLPIASLFLLQLRKNQPTFLLTAALVSVAYAFLAIHQGHLHADAFLEPTQGVQGSWVGVHGIHEGMVLKGDPPLFLSKSEQIILTILSLGGVLGLIGSLLRTRSVPYSTAPTDRLPWNQLLWLLTPFTLVYALLLIPRAAAAVIYDRYALELLLVALILLVRYYQDRIHARLPFGCALLIAIMAIYGVAYTHNNFALYRARVALANELQAHGTPDTSVDNGFEYNFLVELKHANHLNDYRTTVPANAYVPTPPLPPGTCPMFWYDDTPHIHPLYGVSFNPDACYGPAPFPPVHYSRWLAHNPGTLYVVRYTPPAKP